MVYELFLTTQEKNLFLDATAVCGDYVTAYTDREIKHKDLEFMEEHIRKTLRADHYKATVKIFDRTQKKAFLERLDSMNEHKDSLEEGIRFRPDEKYPELSRNELIKHTILAICL